MRRPPWAWLAASLVLLLAVAVVWLSRAGPAIEAASIAQADSSQGAPAVRSAAAPRDQAPALAALDATRGPRALPGAGSLSELTALASGGDPVAACQLAAELMDCRNASYLHGLDAANPGHALTPRCEELLSRHGDRHLEWLRQAAHAGEPEAMLRYVMGEGFGLYGASFDYLRSPGFDAWRREAPGMLQALLEAGYPEAVIYRMVASQPGFGGPMANLLPPDPVQDQAINELFLLLNEDSPLVEMMRMNLRARAGETVAAQARQQAARWHQDHFGGRTWDFEALNASAETAFPAMREHGATCSVPAGDASP